MATMMAPGKTGTRKGIRHRRRCRGLQPDMTALVDIALLLLMFFMVSTSWNTPSAMEMTMPQGERPVNASQVLSVAVQPDGLLKCSLGSDTMRVALGGLGALVADATARLKTIPIVTVDAGSTVRYGQVVDVLDELMLAGADIRSVKQGVIVLNGMAGLSR